MKDHTMYYTRLASAVALLATASAASALDFHGYMRAGIGNNVDGGSQVCYGTGGAAAHYVGRLGDECDMYAELNFGQEVFNQDGKSFAVHSNIAYGTYETGGSVQYNSQGNSYQENKNEAGQYGSPWNSGRMSVREMFVDAKGFLGDSTIWVGKRFGQRKDIHIMDLFYVMNSGYGAGFDGLSAGAGKFSAQWTQGVNNSGPDANLPGVDGTQQSWNRLNKPTCATPFRWVRATSK